MIDWRGMFTIALAVIVASIVLRWVDGRKSTVTSTVRPPAPLSSEDWVLRHYPTATTV